MTPSTRREQECYAPNPSDSCREFPRARAVQNPRTSIPEIIISYDRISVALDNDYLGLYRFYHPSWVEHPKPGNGKCWCGVKLDNEYAVKFEFREPDPLIDEFWMPRTETPENLPIGVGRGFYKLPRRRENLWWLDT